MWAQLETFRYTTPLSSPNFTPSNLLKTSQNLKASYMLLKNKPKPSFPLISHSVFNIINATLMDVAHANQVFS